MNTMDSEKPSPSSKLLNSSMTGGDVNLPGEVDASGSGQRLQVRDAGMDNQMNSWKDVESEAGDISLAVTQKHHKGAADKYKFSTIGHQKRQKQKLVTDFATVRRGGSATPKARPALTQVLFNQAPLDKFASPKERELVETLKQTLESFPVPVLPGYKSEGGGSMAGLPLEGSWTDIVQSHQTMDKTERHQQEALWELLHTELSYIDKLTIIKDLVMAALTHVQQRGFLQEVSHEHLFSNLPSILQAHHQFWQEVMLPMLLQARSTGGPLDPLVLEKGCLEFRERFSTYLEYCWEQERLVEFARRQMDSNPLFHAYIKWVENCPDCERMRLGDMQAKPHQRITKYPLLLKAVLQATQDPQAQYTVRKMLSSVNEFLDNINDHLRLKQEELALSLSAQRVEGYDLVEGLGEEIEKHIRDSCRFDLTSPIRGAGTRDIRKLLLEETLRIKEKRESKLEAVVLLFSDVLLVTKPQRKSERLKIVRPPLSLERINCAALKDGCSFVMVEVGELGCAVNVYTVSTPSQESRTEWINTILSAQKSLAAMRSREMSRRSEGLFRPDLYMETQLYPASEGPIDGVREDRGEAWSSPAGETVVSHENDKENGVIQSENGTVAFQTPKGENHIEPKDWDFPSQDDSFNLSQHISWVAHEDVTTTGSSERQLGATMSEVEEKEDSDSSQLELSEIIFCGLQERRVTWNQSKYRNPSPDRRQSHSYDIQLHADMYMMLRGESDDHSSPKQSESIELLEIKKKLESQMLDRDFRKDSWVSLSEDDTEKVWRFSRRLKSPRLRKRRVLGTHNGTSGQAHKMASVRSGTANSINSSSNSDSSQRFGKNQWSHPQASHHLGSVKRNKDMTRNFAALRDYHQNLSKETSGHNSQKKFKARSPANFTVPDIQIEGEHDVGVGLGGLEDSVLSSSSPKPCSSPLVDILKRATNREKDKEKRQADLEKRNIVVLDSLVFHSPLISPSLPLGEETKREYNLDFVAIQAQDRAQKWQDVDKEPASERGSNEHSYRSSRLHGVSVDWPGWCFDNDEMMAHVVPEDSHGPGSTAGLCEVLTSADPGQQKVQEYQEFGEV